MPDSARPQTAERLPYQVFPDLTPDEFAALREDIAKHGMINPVIVDEAGAVIAGHHRARAWDELRAAGRVPDEDYPRNVKAGLSDAEKLSLAYSDGMLRRNLGPVAWGAAFEKYAALKGVRLAPGRPPGGGNRANLASIAAEVGVPQRTAQRRLALARLLARHPDLARAVDDGAMSPRQAEAEVATRAKPAAEPAAAEDAPAPKPPRDLPQRVRRALGAWPGTDAAVVAAAAVASVQREHRKATPAEVAAAMRARALEYQQSADSARAYAGWVAPVVAELNRAGELHDSE